MAIRVEARQTGAWVVPPLTWPREAAFPPPSSALLVSCDVVRIGGPVSRTVGEFSVEANCQPWGFQNVSVGEVHVSVLQAPWFCTETIHSGYKSKGCMSGSQQGILTGNPQHLRSMLHFWYFRFWSEGSLASVWCRRTTVGVKKSTVSVPVEIRTRGFYRINMSEMSKCMFSL